MVGTVKMKWGLSWLILLLSLIALAWGSMWVKALGVNFGTSEQRIVDLVTFSGLILPIIWCFWFRRLVDQDKGSLGNNSWLILCLGLLILLSTGFSLIELYLASKQSKAYPIIPFFIWRLSSSLLWIFPLGAKAIVLTYGHKQWRQIIYSGAAVILAVSSMIFAVYSGWKASQLLGPIWGYLFSVELVLLCAALTERGSLVIPILSFGIVLLVAIQLKFLIFFAGVFYGGGAFLHIVLASLMFFAFLIDYYFDKVRN